jgi:hypothetical protein
VAGHYRAKDAVVVARGVQLTKQTLFDAGGTDSRGVEVLQDIEALAE